MPNPWEMDWSGGGGDTAEKPPWEQDWSAKPSGGFLNDEDKVAGRAARLVVQGIPRALGGAAALVGDVGINAGKAMFNAGRRSVGGPEIDNPPLPLSTALANSTERWATQLGLPEMPKEGIPGYLGRGAEVATEALTGAGLANLAARGVRAVAPAAARGIESLAARPVQQVVAGLGGQAGSEAAGYLAPDSMAARLIGAGLGTVGGIGATAAVRGAGRFATEKLVRDPRATAAGQMYRAASNPETAITSLDGNAELVPGSRPTTGQQSGDLGLVAQERDLQTRAPAPFQARRDEQAAARSRALEGIQPASQGNTADLLDFAQRTLREEDQGLSQAEESARNAARGQTANFPQSRDASGVGTQIRSDVVTNKRASSANASRLYDAVDPEGTYVVPSQGLREAVHSVYGDMQGFGAIDISPIEEKIIRHVGTLGPEIPFREMVKANKAINAAKRNAGFGTPENERLDRLNSVVLNAITNHTVEAAAANPSVAARLRGLRDEFEAGTGAGDSGAVGENAAVRAGAVPLPRNAEGAGVGRSGGAARPGGVPAAPKRAGKGLTLSQFIARNGGLALDDEAAARDFGNVKVPGVGGALARPNGKSIDGFWRNKLIDEGYLPPDADGGASRDITKELYDALEAERAGRVTRTAQDERQMPLPAADDEGAAHAAAVAQIRDEWKRAGMREQDLHSGALQDAAERVARGEETSGLNAYERAVMDLPDEPAPRPTYPEVPEPPGGFPNALSGPRNDPAAAERYKAARDAYGVHARTFKQGFPKTITTAEGTATNYTVPAEAIPRLAIRPGPEGAPRIRELVAAGAKHSDLADAAAISMRKSNVIGPDGVVDPAAFAKWRQDYEGALGELPDDVRARFTSAALAGETFGVAAARRREAAAAAKSSALGKVAGAGDVADVQGRVASLLSSPQNANRDMGELIRRVRGNADATEGLKRVVADEIAKRVVSASEEVGTSGEKAIKPDAIARLIRDKRPILTQLFGADHVETMAKVSEDLIRAKRSTTGGVKIPGISNTAQDIQLDRAVKQAGEGNLLMRVARAGGVGWGVGGPKGAAVGVAGTLAAETIGKMRKAGLQKVDDLLTEAYLDPAIGRALLIQGKGMANAEKVIVSRLLAKYANPTAATLSGTSQ